MPAAVVKVFSLAAMEREIRDMGIDPASLDWARPLRIVSIYFAAEGGRCFAESRTPDGRPWAPFKRTPSRRRGGRSARLLVDRGILAASMSARSAGPGAVRQITRTDRGAVLLQGSALDYSGYQDQGTGTIPARQFAGVSERMMDRAEQLIADDVVKQMGF
jgi:hypothetical protein